jgi:hypothetical protein
LPTPDLAVLDEEVVAPVAVAVPDVAPEVLAGFTVPEVIPELVPEGERVGGTEVVGEAVVDGAVGDNPEVLVLRGAPAVVEDPAKNPPTVVTCPFANVKTPLPVKRFPVVPSSSWTKPVVEGKGKS